MRDTLQGQWPDDSRDAEGAFRDALWPDNWQTDHLGTVLRGLAYLDALLLVIVDNQLTNPRVLKVAKKPFAEKAKLAQALGAIDDGMLRSLQCLAKIRNSFAHEIGRKLTHADVQELCLGLRGRPRELFVCYTGGSSKSPQRFRHAISVLKIALEEIAYPERSKEYPWFDPVRAAELLTNPPWRDLND